MKRVYNITFLCLLLAACSPNEKSISKPDQNSTPENGNWKFSFISQKHAIPVRMSLQDDSIFFYNSQEKVALAIKYKSDSFFVSIPNFDSHIEGIILSTTQIKGVFIKDYADDYSIPFIASRTDSNVFTSASNYAVIKGKYAVEISDGDKKIPAIGIFEQNGNIISASFAKETGDYRYLEGLVDGNTLRISKFDGSSLQLFTAEIKNDSLLNGVFISGKGGNYKWEGIASENVTLRNPEKLTQLKEGYTEFDFNLMDLDGKPVSLNDEKFKNKIKIIQITGTWCPNCLDETRYFTKLYSKYKDKGLEIIAVAFENGNDTTNVLRKLKQYKQNNDIRYTLLYGGKSSSKDAEEAFPMLNKVMSFPTAIYLNRNNVVLKIYTGFYGPGTGEYYIEYTQNTDNYISTLLEN